MANDARLRLRPVGVGEDPSATLFLYTLLQERDIETQGISHRQMPTYPQHEAFVASWPSRYKDWYIIVEADGPMAGSIYLTKRDEVGVFVRKKNQGLGYGEWAVRQIIARHPEVSEFYANINPRNQASIALFRKLGFSDLQVTLYRRSRHGKGRR